MDTICRDCVFAEWDGNRQIQCEFNRLEKFSEQGVEVEEHQQENGKTYFCIPGRVCNCCRHESMLKDIPVRKWKEKVRQEVRVRVAMAVYVDSDDDESAVIKSLESMIMQTIKPYEIILIYNVEGKDAPASYPIWFSAMANDFSWRIESVKGVPTLMGDLEPADYYSSIDLAVKSKEMKAVYFSVCRAGYEFPIEYIQIIDEAINDDLQRFIALLPDDNGNGLFVQRGLHNLVSGNRKMDNCENVIEKIQYIAGEEGTSSLIKRYSDLV